MAMWLTCSTAPSVTYEVVTEDGKEYTVTNPSEFPTGAKIASVTEPMVAAGILALQDPAALARYRRGPEPVEKPVEGVVIDISRKRVLLDGETAALTYKEFELLQYLVLREGKTIERAQLIAALWADAVEGEDVPNERTIDVHVRRLRSKLGGYEDIVRTVRGAGYRFDRHADVVIRYSTPRCGASR